MAKFRNENLKNKLDSKQPVQELVEAMAIPKPNTTNIQGHEAYSLDNWLQLLTMLNTLKLENQYYRSESKTMIELKNLIDKCAKEDVYLTAQCIVYSRCEGEGMRSISHLASSYLAAYIGGLDWAKRFYSLYDKKNMKGGVIYRPDDMSEIIACFSAINKTKATNSMKKGFADAIERMSAYQILKYKKPLIDVINLAHPDPKKSGAVVDFNNEKINVIDAVIKGLSVSADTWEVAQSEAGQIVAKAVKEGKIDTEEAAEILKEAKADNWNQLLSDRKLGILAALRNIRNVMKTVTNSDTIKLLCDLLSNGDIIRKGKIMPYQIDMANEVVNTEFSDANSRDISKALLKGYEAAVPNLSEILRGNNLVIVDMSASMGTSLTNGDPINQRKYKSSCMDKACLIGSTIAKATNADIIRFGDNAEYVKYNTNMDVFSMAKSIRKDMGCTNLGKAWKLAKESGRKYDRVFILSDNECNRGSSYDGYMQYVKKVGSPYVYSIDMAGYGTTQLVGDKVRYYFGYGYSMFEDIAKSEFNPTYHLDKVKKIVI